MHNYSKTVRTARTTLGLLQKDLSDSGLSRVHICDIESGKSNLTPIKALRLYEKFIYISLIKNIQVELDFDDLFQSDSEYFILKNCYNEIQYMISENNNITKERLTSNITRYQNRNLKKIKFFLLSSIADCYYQLKEFNDSYDYYLHALTFIKYDLDSTIIDSYEDTLEDFHKIALKLSRPKVAIDFYDDIINFRLLNSIQLRNKSYYHLAILENLACNYKSSLGYLDAYLQLQLNLSFDEKINIQIMRASLLMNTGDFSNAINLYALLIDTIDSSIYVKELYLILSDAIRYILKFNISNQSKFLISCSNKLKYLIKSNKKSDANQHRIFSLIGQAQFYNNDYNDSLKYFKYAFKSLQSSTKYCTIEFIELLEASYNSYEATNNLKEFVDKLTDIELNTINNESKLKYLHIQSKLLFNTYDNEMLTQLKNNYG